MTTLPCSPLRHSLLALVLATAGPLLGKETLFVATPLTSGDFTQGIEGPACDREGNIYCVSFRDARNIARVKPDGTAELFVALPEGSWGNGIRFGPAGMMYVADYTGHNNDGKGVIKAIAKVAPLKGQRVVMLGAGGAGRAMAVEIAWAGAAHMTLVTRREEQGREVAERVKKASGVPCEWQPWQSPVRLPKGTTMVMNATHLGCAPHLEPVPVDWTTVDPGCLAVDVITNPRVTPFLQAARERGCPVVDGVEMLVQLAMQIFEQWTGIRPEEQVFQRSVAAALGEGAPEETA